VFGHVAAVFNKGQPLALAVIVVDPDAADKVPGLWATGFVLERLPAEGADAGLPEADRCVPEGVDLESLKEHPVAAAYRKLSWSVGIDPTKNRPAGEALARRILQGKGIPSIHPLVDAYNLASARTLVPLGAYDLDHLRPPVRVALAGPGLNFHGIGRDREPVAEDRIVYLDDSGQVCGVFLWRDAHETRVREASSRVLVLAVGGDPLPIQTGLSALAVVAELAPLVGWRVEAEQDDQSTA
jgi:DNA/RNA-binding domain of Phe-tRNA-synthetase-like protein